MKDEEPAHRVVIIDDSWDIPKLVKLIIGRSHPADTVTVVSSASQGLLIAKHDPPDLIIVRIMMAEMTGYEVCERLKSLPELQYVPVLLQGARASAQVYPTAKQIGAAGYIYEPFHPREFAVAYEAVLRGEEYYPPLPET
jgi:CheY-like chemotaxis protein